MQKNNCYQDTWSDGQARYSHMCYSDLPYLYTGRGFAELNWPYSDDPGTRSRFEVMEYPVGISYWAWGTAWVTHWLNGSPDIEARYRQSTGDVAASADVQREKRIFVTVNAVGFAILALLATWLLAGVNPRRPWDAAAFALSPALLLTGLVNWDMLAVVLVAGALWAWARERPVLTGVLIGLGTAVKLFPLFLLGGVLVICLRNKRIRDFGLATLGAAGAWVLANLPAYLSGPEEWKVFWTFNSDRGADLGSMWLVAQQALDRTGHAFAFDPHTINVGSWLFFGAWCVGVLALGLTAPSTPRLAQLGLPDRGRLPAREQGLLAAVRAVAAAAGGDRPAALARPADLAGRRARLLRVGVVVPRRLPRARVRRRPRLLLGGDADPGRGRAVPGRRWSCATSGTRGTTRCGRRIS